MPGFLTCSWSAAVADLHQMIKDKEECARASSHNSGGAHAPEKSYAALGPDDSEIPAHGDGAHDAMSKDGTKARGLEDPWDDCNALHQSLQLAADTAGAMASQKDKDKATFHILIVPALAAKASGVSHRVVELLRHLPDRH